MIWWSQLMCLSGCRHIHRPDFHRILLFAKWPAGLCYVMWRKIDMIFCLGRLDFFSLIKLAITTKIHGIQGDDPELIYSPNCSDCNKRMQAKNDATRNGSRPAENFVFIQNCESKFKNESLRSRVCTLPCFHEHDSKISHILLLANSGTVKLLCNLQKICN